MITAGGHRLRDVARRPATTLTALHISASGRSATLHAAPGIRPSSELNSHLAIHDDHRSRRGIDHHVVLHAQPLRLVFLSHLPDVTTSAQLSERLLRWEPETAVVAPEGKHGIVTRSDASATQAADLVEYLEAAATYEVMNLSMGSPASGLDEDERAAVAEAFGLGV